MAAATPKRKDPKTRSPRTINNSDLLNRDPSLYYVAVDKATGACEEYEGMGYHYVKASETGVKFLAGKSVPTGEPLEYRGHILMAIAKEEREHIEQYGVDGGTGYNRADELEAQLIDKSGVQTDLMRGINSRYTRVESEIQPLQRGF
jgi:hypothetical protein